MLKAKSPISGNQIQRPKTGRKPLQPKNSPATPIINHVNGLKKHQCIEISIANDSNKENHPVYATPTKIIKPVNTTEPFGASLADELSVIRERLERLRVEKEKTEKILNERDMVLDMQMKELERRGEVQKQLEIEVDRLFRLKELRALCMRKFPMQSLREKEQIKIKGYQSQDVNTEDREEDLKDEEGTSQSPSSEIDREK
ncbi:unnamed protein product [Ilex paraguariensis]|uniref:High mobility group B protein 6 n=1 Tax=Ilex paraguariensis TaxID=185542 RepID=A0ABC8RLM0_9AQUA